MARTQFSAAQRKRFNKDMRYEAALIDLDRMLVFARAVAQRSRARDVLLVLDRQWAANFRRKHKMDYFKKVTTERLPFLMSHRALGNKSRRDYFDLVEQPRKYGVRIPKGDPQTLPLWAQFGLDETPPQHAPKLRGENENDMYDTTTALTRGKPLW